MATAREQAEGLMRKLVREQCYLLMMRPKDPPPDNPPPDNPPGAQDALRVDHHAYLVDLERRGVLVGAGPCRDGEDWVRGNGLIIVRANNRADAAAIGAEEPYTKAGFRHMDIIPWQRNEGNMTVNLRLADGVLEIDNRRWAIGPAD